MWDLISLTRESAPLALEGRVLTPGPEKSRTVGLLRVRNCVSEFL